MGKPVLHQQVYRKSAFGGNLNTTLCGRLAHGNDMNVAESEPVTCKLCLKRIAQLAQQKKG